ncbi:MAG: ABC transporter permease [Desulfurococcaceae archaeon]
MKLTGVFPFIKLFSKRALYAILTIMVAVSVTFVAIRSMPGDVLYTLAVSLAEELRIPVEEAKRIVFYIYYGIDVEEPIYLQYLKYVIGLLQGNLGYSTYFKRPVTYVVARALGWTAFTLSVGISLSFAIGILIGMLAGFKRGTKFDSIISLTSTVLSAIPGYVVALLLYIMLSARLGLLPARGAYSPHVEPGLNLAFIIDVLYHAALPVLTYVIITFSGWTLLIRSNVAKILEEDFLKYAEARGISRRRIVTTYIGRNSILPIVPLLAIRVGSMIGGSTLIETIFAYPGMGYYLSLALSIRDYGLLQGIYFMMIVATIVAVIVVELLTPLIDPRVRREVVAT